MSASPPAPAERLSFSAVACWISSSVSRLSPAAAFAFGATADFAGGGPLEQSVVQPVLGHRLAVAALALGDFVLVMRKDQVESTAVDVERLAQQAAAHRRALDVPAGASLAPGAVPGRFARLGRFPEREVGGGAFLGRGLATFALQRIDGAIGQLAVFAVPGHVEEHVAIDFVGKAPVDQRLRQGNDVVHRFGRLGHLVDLIDSQAGQILQIVFGVLPGHLRHRDAALARLLDQLVVHVGDVDDPRDVVAGVDQVSLDRVEDHRTHHVADVGSVVHGRAAQVDVRPCPAGPVQTSLWSGSACCRREEPCCCHRHAVLRNREFKCDVRHRPAGIARSVPLGRRVAASRCGDGSPSGRDTVAETATRRILVADLPGCCRRRLPSKHDALGRDRFLSTDRSHLFTRLGLQPHRIGRNPEDLGDPLANLSLVGAQFGPLGEDDTVEILHMITGLPNLLVCQSEHFRGIPAAILPVACRETTRQCLRRQSAPSSASVTACSKHIGIAVSQQVGIVRDVDAAQAQRTAGSQPMRVVSYANPVADRDRSLVIRRRT